MKTGGSDMSWISSQVGDFDIGMQQSHHWRIHLEYPEAKAVTAPEHISAAVRRCFLQAGEAALRNHFDAAGSMYRKSIDLATKELDINLAGKLLFQRINALHAAGKLTDDLKEWAHQVRLDGNDATHEEEELTVDDIKTLASFSELFLTYTFTLPRKIAVLKATEDMG